MTKPGTFCCAAEENEVQKEKLCGFAAKLETQEKRKKGGAGRVPGPKKAPQGSWPNGNEPQGLLCFTGRSSACENL